MVRHIQQNMYFEQGIGIPGDNIASNLIGRNAYGMFQGGTVRGREIHISLAFKASPSLSAVFFSRSGDEDHRWWFDDDEER